MTLKEYLSLPFEKIGYVRIQVGRFDDFVAEQHRLCRINGKMSMQDYLDGALYEGRIEDLNVNDLTEEDLQRKIISIRIMNPSFHWQPLPSAGMLIEII